MGVDFDGDYYGTEDLLSEGGWGRQFMNKTFPQQSLIDWVDQAARDGYDDIEELYVEIADRLADQRKDIEDGYLEEDEAYSSDEIYDELIEYKSGQFADRIISTMSTDEAALIWTEAGCYNMDLPDMGIDYDEIESGGYANFYRGLFSPYLYEYLTSLYYSLAVIYRRQRL